MSRKTAIILLASIALAVGLGIIITNIPFAGMDSDSMPVCSLNYVGIDDSEKSTGLNKTGYRWRVKDPQTDAESWETVGPENFFNENYAVKEIIPGNLEVHLQIIWNDPPDYIVMRKWPLSEWTPGGDVTKHPEGMDVEGSWEKGWKKTNIGFDAERGSIYGVWAYYGDAWVEYSFIVAAEDPTTYDYLGYFSGFDNPKAEEFTLDSIEWIDMSNTRRIDELNLSIDDDFPSGFYIYNPTKEAMALRLTDQTKYAIIDPETGNTSKIVEIDEFLNHLNQLPDYGETTPFWISETDGDVEFIKEQYVP